MSVAVPVRSRRLSRRGRALIGCFAAIAWAVGRAGIGDEIVNGAGWNSFGRFWTAVADPALSADFLRLTVDAAVVTLSYAVLGTVLSLVIGAVGAITLSELLTGRGVLWRLARLGMVVPRAVHEILWALLLIRVFGFDPFVAVFAIGVPFGAVTAKVFAETIDESDPRPYVALRSGGAPRLVALAYGVLPSARGELVAYAFYRFECAIRSAAVLGVIGAGGIGFQLDLSFESLRYDEIWTLIAALMVLSGLVETWSSTVRRSRAGAVTRLFGLGVLVLIPLSWRWVGMDPPVLWSATTWERGVELLGDLIPPRLGPGGWGELASASIDTVAMSVLALTIAAGGGLLVGSIARRPIGLRSARGSARRVGRGVARLGLLLCRAVPAPIWAFLFVLVLFPGPWPGAVALGVYNLGVLGRLYAETLEDRDPRPADALILSGASGAQVFAYGTLPTSGPRLVALTTYRWEVIARETVVVGVVGAGGLGQLINDHLVARDLAAVAGAIGALIVISIAIDTLSAWLRRELR